MSDKHDFPLLQTVRHIDGFEALYSKGGTDFMEHVVRDLFKQMTPHLMERYGGNVEVRELSGLFHGHKLDSREGRALFASGRPVQCIARVMLLTEAEYLSLEDRARYGDKVKSETAAKKAFNDGIHSERSRLKQRLRKVVDRIIDPPQEDLLA
jgi:hypothetical protein